MISRPILFASFASLATIAGAQDAPRQHKAQPTTVAITPADLRTRLYIIADDSMEGRQAGKNGNYRATSYIAREFKRLGLTPAGDSGTFFQTIPYVQRLASSWSRLVINGAPLDLWTDYALMGTNPLAPATMFETERTEAVYGGRMGDSSIVIAPDKVEGKLVVLAPVVGPSGTPIAQLNAATLAEFQGAAAIAVAYLDAVPPAVVANLKLPRTVTPMDTSLHGPMLIAITNKTAERLIGGPFDKVKPAELGNSIRARVAYEFKPTEAPARNVIAILKGSDPKLAGQYVAVGAHNDHIGMMPAPVDHDSLRAFNRVMRPQGANDRPGAPTAEQWTQIHAGLDSLRKKNPPRLDSIANGADDDGSGTAVLLEIAEWFAKTRPHPKRSIIFVSHTGEEAGLLGSQHFTDHPTVARDSIVAQLNMDMVGRGRAEDVKAGGPTSIQMIGSRRLSTQLGDIIDSLNTHPTAARQQMEIDYSFDAAGHPLNRYCRSDHYMYARYGIPITYFSLGYHIDYHMVSDEVQYIDFDHSARVGNLVKDVALTVANRPERIVVDKPKPDPKGGCRQ
ncbi:MAG: M28 family peptidase [Gemmatimonadaceae bacterium]